MTAQVIQIRDYHQKERERREDKALKALAYALSGHPHEQAIYESSVGFIAPEDDPA